MSVCFCETLSSAINSLNVFFLVIDEVVLFALYNRLAHKKAVSKSIPSLPTITDTYAKMNWQ